jgi:hypothetical protein
VTALPVLLNGNKFWTVKRKGINKTISRDEMFKNVEGITRLGHVKNEVRTEYKIKQTKSDKSPGWSDR